VLCRNVLSLGVAEAPYLVTLDAAGVELVQVLVLVVAANLAYVR